ncbi:hypothetical protein [Caldalkalibacillus salinus]|uniref:hypothetical protein n=1 Tax=Caldalkalibacillus salinus TaxID=2803787 RepID=UPI001924B28F|nr:hypothetical protein [Caldalkalibacillus salinus]
MVPFMWLMIYISYILLLKLFTLRLYRYFRQQRWMMINHRGDQTVQSFGLLVGLHYMIFLMLLLIASAFTSAYPPVSTPVIGNTALMDMVITLLLLFPMLLIGWIDDHYGEERVKGLKGHFFYLLKQGKLSTGLLKALMGIALSFFVATLYSEALATVLFYTLLLSTSIHVSNLLDVRPGRSIKAFWIVCLFTISSLYAEHRLAILFPFLLSTFFLFEYDRRRKAMLGDTGANVLGGLAGVFLIQTHNLGLQMGSVMLFLFLSLFAERRSMTSYIEKTPWLSRLDRWGTR